MTTPTEAQRKVIRKVLDTIRDETGPDEVLIRFEVSPRSFDKAIEVYSLSRSSAAQYHRTLYVGPRGAWWTYTRTRKITGDRALRYRTSSPL